MWADNQDNDDDYIRHENLSDRVAGMMIESPHGTLVSVEDAMRQCIPFRSMVESILDVGGEDILELAIPKMTEKAFTAHGDPKKNSSNQPNPVLY